MGTNTNIVLLFLLKYSNVLRQVNLNSQYGSALNRPWIKLITLLQITQKRYFNLKNYE